MNNQINNTNTSAAINLDTGDLFNLLFSNFDDSLLLIDKELKIKLTNEVAKQKIKDDLGYTCYQDMSVLELVSPERREGLKQLYNEVFAGKERTSVITIARKDGKEYYYENHFKPAVNKEGIIVGAVVIIRDITDKKNAELHLKELEERWRFALEGANQGVWDWNMETNEVYYSDSYKKLYGFNDNELDSNQQDWEDRVHPDDKDKMKDAIEKHLNSKDPYYESVYRLKDKKGQYRWILARGMLIGKNKSGKPLRMIGTHTDITERVNAEENYKLLFYNNPLPMWTYELNSLKFLNVNNAAIEHYGFSREEFLNMTIRDIRPVEDHKLIEQQVEKRKNTITFRTVSRHKKRNGEIIFVEISTYKLEKENADSVLVLANDITEKTKAQNELVRSNERFLYAAKASSEALWEWNISTGEYYISEAYTDMFGWEVKNTQNFDVWQNNIHTDDRKLTTESFYGAIEDPKTDHWSKEYRFMKSDGSYATLINKAVILRNEKNVAVKIIGAIQDVTNQKKAEEDLRKSNERFLLASRAASDAIYDWDLVNNEVHWSEGINLLFGYPQHNMPIDLWKDSLHPDDQDRIHKSLSRAKGNTKKKIWKEEYRFRKADGSWSHVLDRGFIIRDENKNAIRMVGSMQDITERKHNEQLLSMERSIFELSASPGIEFEFIVGKLLRGIEAIYPDAYTSVLVLKSDGTIESLAAPRLPAAYTNLLNGMKLGPDEGSCGVAMHSKKTVIVDNIDTDVYWKNYREVAAKFGLKACWSLPIVHSSDTVMGTFGIYYKEVRTPTDAELNTLDRIRNILRILMEHHWSLNEIKIAKERFDIMMKATHDLIWDWDFETAKVYRDEEGLKTVYGLKSNDSIETLDKWLARIHPDDRLRVRKVIEQISKSRKENTFDVEYRFKKEDNSYSSVYDRGVIIRNNSGKPIRMIGAAQDITQRKQMEQELLQNELERQKAINQATVDTQEQERSEIGKELHDNINQVLTTTKLYLDLALSSPELKDELIQKSSKNIIGVINEIRQLSRSLMDPTIGDLGLIDSINDLIENINLTRKLHVSLKVDKLIESILDKNHKLTLFRIIQEALNNAIKHAKATSVSIHLHYTGKTISLTIQDDGVGFHPENVKKGVGLKNIQNRIYLINGTHSIKSAPDKGCIININFPIHQ